MQLGAYLPVPCTGELPRDYAAIHLTTPPTPSIQQCDGVIDCWVKNRAVMRIPAVLVLEVYTGFKFESHPPARSGWTKNGHRVSGIRKNDEVFPSRHCQELKFGVTTPHKFLLVEMYRT